MDSVIAGAVFDFAAYLSTRPDAFTVSAHHECAPVLMDHLKAWAKERGLSIEDVNHQWDQLGAANDYVKNAKLGERLVTLLDDALEGRR